MKPQAKRATVGMTDEDLAGFLKDMAGGEIEATEGMESVISAAKEVWFFLDLLIFIMTSSVITFDFFLFFSRSVRKQQVHSSNMTVMSINR